MIFKESIVQILLVEDNPDDAELALHALRKHNLANQIAWVKDGEEALEFLFHRGQYINNEGLPKVVMLDLRLPKLDGIDVLKALRANPDTHELPVVVLTSSKEERDVVESYKLGVNSYVSKPVVFKEFAETVATLGLYWILINRVPPEIAGK
ncbi:two-component system response regulator [Methylomonas lenta]|uniref:Two-component system response regulator n=1 Tax=Methylomonas lenta TaxID=980561 RepID=A0A177MWZ3_9GAMM|nr:response regulator [Methylomonas lenta]OAI09904.1 two-component system response regulator [Methylomonas lenta]